MTSIFFFFSKIKCNVNTFFSIFSKFLFYSCRTEHPLHFNICHSKTSTQLNDLFLIEIYLLPHYNQSTTKLQLNSNKTTTFWMKLRQRYKLQLKRNMFIQINILFLYLGHINIMLIFVSWKLDHL